MSEPRPTRHLRFTTTPHPSRAEATSPRGRSPSWIPLLIAMDGVCRLGSGRRKPGRCPRSRVKITRDQVILDLADLWSKDPESIKPYLKDSDKPRHYWRRARTIVAMLRRQRFTVEDISRAIAEHYPNHGTKQLAPLAPGAHHFLFALNPVVPLVNQPTARRRKHTAVTGKTERLTKETHPENALGPVHAALERGTAWTKR